MFQIYGLTMREVAIRAGTSGRIGRTGRVAEESSHTRGNPYSATNATSDLEHKI